MMAMLHYAYCNTVSFILFHYNYYRESHIVLGILQYVKLYQHYPWSLIQK